MRIVDGIFNNVARQFLADVTRGDDWGYHQEEDFCWVRTNPASEYPNLICNTRFNDETVENRIGDIIHRIRKGKLPSIWAVGPLSQPADLTDHLKANGFKEFINFPGMACDLQAIDKNRIENSPLRFPSAQSSLEIVRIHDDKGFKDWVDANCAGFHEQFQSNGCEEGVYRHLLDTDNSPENRFYCARLDDDIVGAAQAIYYPDSPTCHYVELHQCSVIQAFRKMGIARRLVSRPALVVYGLP